MSDSCHRRVRLALVASGLILAGCISSSPPPAAPVPNPPAPIDLSQVPGVIDKDLTGSAVVALGSQAAQPPFPGTRNQPPNFVNTGSAVDYAAWLGGVENALKTDTPPSANSQWLQAANSIGITIAVASVDVSCLHKPSCKDTDLQKAELQNLDRAKSNGSPVAVNLGYQLFSEFHPQPQQVRDAAVNYLDQHYSFSIKP